MYNFIRFYNNNYLINYSCIHYIKIKKCLLIIHMVERVSNNVIVSTQTPSFVIIYRKLNAQLNCSNLPSADKDTLSLREME